MRGLDAIIDDLGPIPSCDRLQFRFSQTQKHGSPEAIAQFSPAVAFFS
jgi:hypothetical protein